MNGHPYRDPSPPSKPSRFRHWPGWFMFVMFVTPIFGMGYGVGLDCGQARRTRTEIRVELAEDETACVKLCKSEVRRYVAPGYRAGYVCECR